MRTLQRRDGTSLERWIQIHTPMYKRAVFQRTASGTALETIQVQMSRLFEWFSDQERKHLRWAEFEDWCKDWRTANPTMRQYMNGEDVMAWLNANNFRRRDKLRSYENNDYTFKQEHCPLAMQKILEPPKKKKATRKSEKDGRAKRPTAHVRNAEAKKACQTCRKNHTGR